MKFYFLKSKFDLKMIQLLMYQKVRYNHMHLQENWRIIWDCMTHLVMSTIPPVSTKWTSTYHFNLPNTKKGHNIWSMNSGSCSINTGLLCEGNCNMKYLNALLILAFSNNQINVVCTIMYTVKVLLFIDFVVH
jgi:hypothetical protein